MGENSLIEWADHTFNPWIGCTRVSPGCDNCYAEKLATQRLGVAWGPHAERRRTAESTWRQPLAWNRKAEREGKRARVFCASLADVFDNAVPEEWRTSLWHLIAQTPNLDWLLLTKRPQNIAKMLPHSLWPWRPWGDGWPNVWLGTTAENQDELRRRVPHLRAVPAAVYFLSCEPLLGPLELTRDRVETGWDNWLTGDRHRGNAIWSEGAGIDWLIAGGESGPGARPAHPDWFRSLRDQCAAAGVPFFFKQWGEWLGGAWEDHDEWKSFEDTCGNLVNLVGADSTRPRFNEDQMHAFKAPDTWDWTGPGAVQVGKKVAGALLDGREHRELPHA